MSELTGAEYEAVHRAAIDAYEAATPPDYRYSATALRKSVDAAIAVYLASVPTNTVGGEPVKPLDDNQIADHPGGGAQ